MVSGWSRCKSELPVIASSLCGIRSTIHISVSKRYLISRNLKIRDPCHRILPWALAMMRAPRSPTTPPKNLRFRLHQPRWFHLLCCFLLRSQCSSFLSVPKIHFLALPHDPCRHDLHTAFAASRTQPSWSSLDVVQTTPAVHPQSIAVVGSGAVGCYYGARLWEAGHDVQFYMRGDHYTASTELGLNVTSHDGDMFIGPEELKAFDSTADNIVGPVDWVIVAVKSSSLQAIPDLIFPLLDADRTRVLVIMNGLIEEDLIRMMKEKAGERTSSTSDVDDRNAPLQCCRTLYGGMALLCSNRLGPGRIDHSYAGLLSGGVASTKSNDASADRQAFEELWRHVKVPIAYEPCLLKGRWRKMIWNLAFNGLSTAMGGWTIDRIVTDPSLRRLADIIMDETIAAGNADLERKYGKGNFDPLRPEDKDPMMTLSDNMGPYKTSTMLDLTNRRPMEVKYLFQVPVERARKLGVPAFHLETVVAQIEALQRLYGL